MEAEIDLRLLLTNALSADNITRQNATELIDKLFKSSSKANFRLIDLIQKEDSAISTLAALVLKNNLMNNAQMFSESDIEFIFSSLIQMLQNMPSSAKSYYPALINAICTIRGSEFAGKVMMYFKEHFLPHSHDLIKLVGLQTVRDLITGPNKIDIDQTILSSCYPSLISFLKSANRILKITTLKIILGLSVEQNSFIKQNAVSVLNEVNSVHDFADFECTNMILNTNSFIYLLAPVEIDTLIPNCLEAALYTLENVKNLSTILIATDFFRNILLVNKGSEHLQKIFPRLIQILAKNSIFSQDEIEIIEEHIEEDWNIPDTSQIAVQQDSLSDYDQIFASWTVRKSSALTIDLLSVNFGSTISPFLLPIIEIFLKESHWSYLECANLLLGAISKGCQNDILQHLNSLVPLILNSCSNSKSIVRSTSLWTLSRFSEFILEDMKFKDSYIDLLCKMLSDGNKKVVNAAIHALINLQSKLQFETLPFLNGIGESVMKNIGHFQSNSITALCLLVEIVVDTVDHYILDSESFTQLVMYLSEKFLKINEFNIELKTVAKMLSKLIETKIFDSFTRKNSCFIDKSLLILNHEFNLNGFLQKNGPIFNEQQIDVKSVQEIFSYGMLEFYISLVSLIDTILKTYSLKLGDNTVDFLLCLCSFIFASNNVYILPVALSTASNIVHLKCSSQSNVPLSQNDEKLINFVFKKAVLVCLPNMVNSSNIALNICSSFIDSFGYALDKNSLQHFCNHARDSIALDLNYDLKFAHLFALIKIIQFDKNMLLSNKDTKFLLSLIHTASYWIKCEDYELSVHKDFGNILLNFIIEFNYFDEELMKNFLDLCCLVKGIDVEVGQKIMRIVHELPLGFLTDSKKSKILGMIS